MPLDEAKREKIITELARSYNMEIETVANYIANSVWLDGIRAKHIKDALAADVQEELGHAQQLANRIKVLDGKVPGSQALKMEQSSLQPPKSSTDVVSVIKGVIEAEEGAIAQYHKLIRLCGDDDPVTQDLCITLMGDEEEHRRMFKGFLREVEQSH
ncbi:MAG: ferritin-like domain-containing protein [Phycisphaeraceae bacterium]|nr:ferritin-like domain-containing protein [Phycisphaeraceae bacterium]